MRPVSPELVVSIVSPAGSLFCSNAVKSHLRFSAMADAEYPLKGRGLKIVQADFENYKEWKGQSDLILYRTSKPKWWVPSLLLDNIFNERWKLSLIHI